MFRILYIISLVLMMIGRFGVYKLNYFFQLSIGIVWIVIWMINRIAGTKILKIDKIVVKYIVPWLLIGLWSGIIWSLNPPDVFDASYIGRMVSNLTLVAVAIINAYIGVYFFGKDIIYVAYTALLSCIAVNFVLVVPQYGFNLVIDYLFGVLVTDFQYGSIIWQLSYDLEVQGVTMALGMFLCYFLIADDIPQKRKIKLILVSIPFLYIGFKRTVVLGVLIALCLNFLISFKKINFKQLIYVASFIFCIIAISYIVIIKTDFLEVVVTVLGIDTLGRTRIYSQVSQFFDLSPFYMGVGFCYIGKYLYESIGFAAHSEILRMYTEIGFIPFIAWIIYYLMYMPEYVYNKFGKNYGKVCLIVSVYVYSTYLVENTLVSTPMLYGYAVFCFIGLSNKFQKKQEYPQID